MKAKLGLEISETSIKQILHEMDFNYGPKLKVVSLTSKQREDRFSHCIDIKDKNGLKFERILFSDESYFKANCESTKCWQKRGARVLRGEK